MAASDDLDDYFDTCDHCGAFYNPDQQGFRHDPDCKCCYCDPNHDDYDSINAAPIIAYVEKHGYLYFCSQECESNFINNS